MMITIALQSPMYCSASKYAISEDDYEIVQCLRAQHNNSPAEWKDSPVECKDSSEVARNPLCTHGVNNVKRKYSNERKRFVSTENVTIVKNFVNMGGSQLTLNRPRTRAINMRNYDQDLLGCADQESQEDR